MPTLLDRLERMMPTASRRTLKQLLKHGRVAVDSVVVREAGSSVSDSARVEVLPKESDLGAPAPLIRIVYEDSHLVVVDKPAGLLTVSERSLGQPSAWSLLRRTLASRADDRVVDLHLIHRLDREASGLLVFARTTLARDGMKNLFASHDLDRHYAAIVDGVLTPPEGESRQALFEADDARHRVRVVGRGVRPAGDARPVEARTRWLVRAAGDGFTAVEVRLETGRKHQIRVHLSELGHPVVGDELYGDTRAPRLLLHAWVLAFRHPATGNPLRCEVRPPGVFERYGLGAWDGGPRLGRLPSG